MRYIEPSSDQRLAVLKAANATDRLLDKAGLKEILPLSDPTIWRFTEAGQFPPTVKLGRRSAWRLSSVLWYCELLEQEG